MDFKMKNELSTQDISTIIARARQRRSDAAGALIAVSTRKALAWVIKRSDRFLHALLMSPANTR